MQTQTQPIQVDAMAVLTVRLQAQVWNQVIAAMGKAKYEVAAPLIHTIGEQLAQQTRDLQTQNGVEQDTQPALNGLDIGPSQ